MVKGKAEGTLQVETEWIREYAKSYLPTEFGFSYAPSDLRAANVSLVNIRSAIINGVVVFSDKLDDPGAIWIVEGQDQDERYLRLELHVVSEPPSVTLRSIEIVDPVVEGGDDAA